MNCIRNRAISPGQLNHSPENCNIQMSGFTSVAVVTTQTKAALGERVYFSSPFQGAETNTAGHIAFIAKQQRINSSIHASPEDDV